jgi:hypothetical protein
MKNWKGLQMKKITSIVAASLIAACSYTPAAYAWGEREQGILTGVAGLWAYQQLAKPSVTVYQQSVPVYQQPQTVYVYPTRAPVAQYPNTVCELRSEYVNGQVVTGNFCYQR